MEVYHYNDEDNSLEVILNMLKDVTKEEINKVLSFRNENYSQNVAKLEPFRETSTSDCLVSQTKNPCFICNGFYGFNYEDPTCTSCHKFLYPNPVPKSRLIDTMFQMASEDSDSGNDEPSDIVQTGNSSIFNLLSEENPSPVEQSKERVLLESDHTVSPQSLEEPVSVCHKIEITIQALPLEVLMHIFSYLDDISLWSVGQVCIRWQQVLDMYIRPEAWKNFTLLRWPLYDPVFEDANWYKIYTSFIRNSWCIKCIIEMAAQVGKDGDNFWRRGRLSREIRSIKQDPIEGIQAKPLDHFLCHWQATIAGPIGSPYEGGLFYLYVQVPYSYPMNPPVVRFLTRIFHPNISRHGDVGIDCIHQNWSLALTVSKVLLSIQSLLTDPFCDVCMEPEVGALYLKDREAFDRKARLWTRTYAMTDMAPH